MRHQRHTTVIAPPSFSRALILLSSLLWGAGACTPAAWNPSAPSGTSWSYRRAGAYRWSHTATSDRVGNYQHYRSAFVAGQTHLPQGVSPERYWRQQGTWQQTLFNGYLGDYGERLQADPVDPVAQAPQKSAPPSRAGRKAQSGGRR